MKTKLKSKKNKFIPVSMPYISKTLNYIIK